LEAKEKVHITICDPILEKSFFYHHILRVTAWCKRYATNLHKKEKQWLSKNLQLKENEQAEQVLFITSQK